MKLTDIPRNAILSIRNSLRSLRREGLEYVVLSLEGSYPERTPRRDPLPFPFNRLSIFPTEASLEDVREIFEIVGGDERVRGVVLRFGALRAQPAALHSLRRMVLDLRARGKRVIAWLPGAETWDFYLASACDEIFLPESGRLSALGLRSEPIFLKEALATAGVEADIESIAEYKVTPDTFRRSTMTEPHREMLEAILGSLFDEFVAGVAEGRGLGRERVRELIDGMPYTAGRAAETGLIDGALYEDELAAHLSPAGPEEAVEPTTWEQARRWLHRPVRWTTRQLIGVISLEGLIVPGRSRRVPVPLPLPFEAQAGAETIIQALRRAEEEERIAAVIFHVETPGGSSLASDLIWREVWRLRERKPVVVLMGDQAASGGYYVAAPASRIVARPTTLTGSIGIWGGKFTFAELYHKLGVEREAVQRGAMAGLFTEMSAFSEEQRAWLRRDLGQAYARFKERVGEGRGMTTEQVEEIARGRVWTGAQAREIGLVDELGDFETALSLARELADLDPEREYTVVEVRPPRREILPPRPQDGSLVPPLGGLLDLAHERLWALAPWTIRLRG